MSGKHYSDLERERIAVLHLDGLSAPKIATVVKRPASGIRTVLRKLELVDDRIRRYDELRYERGMTDEQHKEFCRFLRTNAGEYAPAELVERWILNYVSAGYPEVSYDKVVHWMQKMRCGTAGSRQEIAAAYPDAKKRRRAKLARLAKERSTEADAAFLHELDKAARRIFRADKQHPRRDCETCGETRPLTEQFFRLSKGKKHSHFSIRCVMCDRERVRWVNQLRANGTPPDRIKALLKQLYRNLWTQRAAERRRRTWELHETFMKTHPKARTRRCVCCRTPWLVRKDAYHYYPERRAYSGMCLFCAGEFRRRIANAVADGVDPTSIRDERSRAYDRDYDERAAEHHERAKLVAKQFLAKHKHHKKRHCPGCRTDYPLNRANFRRERNRSFQYVCRWCRSKYERKLDRACGNVPELKAVREWYAALIEIARDLERKARNDELRRKARAILSKNKRAAARDCPRCEHRYPLTKVFWRFNAEWTKRRGQPVLNSKLCTCCFNDDQVKKWRRS
ncbi:MAG: helix-turn-helix domain-containing protein [Bdellovibrionota bacterium]